MMTQGGSAHYVRHDLSSSVTKRAFSKLETIDERGDDGMADSVDVVDAHRKRSSVSVEGLSTLVRIGSTSGLFSHAGPRPTRALTTEPVLASMQPLRTYSSSVVRVEELTQHARRAAWSIERSFTCAEVNSSLGKMSLGGSSDDEG